MFPQLKPKQNNPKRSGPRQGFKIKISPIEILKCTFYISELFVIFTFSLKQNGLSTFMCRLLFNKILNHYYQSTLLYIKINKYLESFLLMLSVLLLPCPQLKQKLFKTKLSISIFIFTLIIQVVLV